MNALDFLILAVLLCWLGGFSLHAGGGAIHVLLLAALALLLVRAARGRRD